MNRKFTKRKMSNSFKGTYFSRDVAQSDSNFSESKIDESMTTEIDFTNCIKFTSSSDPANLGTVSKARVFNVRIEPVSFDESTSTLTLSDDSKSGKIIIDCEIEYTGSDSEAGIFQGDISVNIKKQGSATTIKVGTMPVNTNWIGITDSFIPISSQNVTIVANKFDVYVTVDLTQDHLVVLFQKNPLLLSLPIQKYTYTDNTTASEPNIQVDAKLLRYNAGAAHNDFRLFINADSTTTDCITRVDTLEIQSIKFTLTEDSANPVTSKKNGKVKISGVEAKALYTGVKYNAQSVTDPTLITFTVTLSSGNEKLVDAAYIDGGYLLLTSSLEEVKFAYTSASVPFDASSFFSINKSKQIPVFKHIVSDVTTYDVKVSKLSTQIVNDFPISNVNYAGASFLFNDLELERSLLFKDSDKADLITIKAAKHLYTNLAVPEWFSLLKIDSDAGFIVPSVEDGILEENKYVRISDLVSELDRLEEELQEKIPPKLGKRLHALEVGMEYVDSDTLRAGTGYAKDLADIKDKYKEVDYD